MKVGLVHKDLRSEVRAYLRKTRLAAIMTMLIGCALVVWPRLTGEWPMMGPVPMQRIRWGLIALAWVTFAVIIARRSAYYRRRLRETGLR